jgi:NAD(P)H-dependent FMN reductase
MKILAINGSHRGGRGATGHLVSLLAEGAREAGADFDSLALAQHKIRRCLGCFACQTQHPLRCVFDGQDDVPAILDRMRGADLLVYATPVYVFGVSSLLKAFYERFMSTARCADLRVSRSGLFFHHIDPDFGSKPFVALVCCDNLEDATPRNAVEYFRTYARFMDAPLAGTLVRPMAQALMLARGPDGQRRFPLAEDVFAAFRQAGRELARQGRIARLTERRAGRGILPIPLLARVLMPFVPAVKRELVRRAREVVPVVPPEPASPDGDREGE